MLGLVDLEVVLGEPEPFVGNRARCRRIEFRTLERKSMSETASPNSYGRVSVILSPPWPVRGTRCSPAESLRAEEKIRSSSPSGSSLALSRQDGLPSTSWIASSSLSHFLEVLDRELLVEEAEALTHSSSARSASSTFPSVMRSRRW